MSQNPFSLEGEIALITGGGTGLGLGMATCMLRAGAKVIIVGRRQETLDEALKSLGDGAYAMTHDVTDMASAPELVARVSREVGAPTILVNNAGVHLKKPAIETTDEEFATVLQTHVNGAFALTRAVAPGMIERRHGSIIFISSMTAFMGMPLVVAYSTAKSAVQGMVYTLSEEFSPSNVRVNAIAPGWIDSPMLQKAINSDPERKRRIISRIQMDGFGEPADVGNAAVYLSSPAAKYVTGVILPVDGGGVAGF
jgi:NAD(P)-dependent dehydrogenase (short-subunit alcohol dehydrogenase family)